MKVNISRSKFLKLLNKVYKKNNKNFNAADIIGKYEFLCKSISQLIVETTTNEILLLINNNKKNNVSDREMLISLSKFSILIDLKIKEVILELLKKYLDNLKIKYIIKL